MVYEWMVVMYACSIPHNSLITCNMGAALFVVQEAFDTIQSLSFNKWSFTPNTIILIDSSKGGTERMTRFAPLAKCVSRAVFVLNMPVASITMSTSGHSILLMVSSRWKMDGRR